MSSPSYLKPAPDGILLQVKVQPRAARDEIAESLGNELRVRIAAPPVDSAANEALVRFLAEVLDCPRSAVRLVRGRTSRHKVLCLAGISLETAAAKLQA